MKFLGIDYGAKRLGIAISDDGGTIAFPLVTLDTTEALEEIKKLVDSRRIAEIVIGDTRAVSGEANTVTKDAAEFSKKLAAETGVPIRDVWEAWSSVEASRYAPKGHEHDDAAAAAIILQRFRDVRTT